MGAIVSDGGPFCLFCAIVEGTIPADVVGETEQTLAFRDINPAAPTHVLIVPKAHVADAAAVDKTHGGLLAEMLAEAASVARSEGIADSGYRLVFNVGDDAGNTVAHLHLHLIGGREMAWPPG
jgi:histidine triad (HIT) family protein